MRTTGWGRGRIVAGALLLAWTTIPAAPSADLDVLVRTPTPGSWRLLIEVGASSPLTAPLTGAILLGAVLDDGAPF